MSSGILETKEELQKEDVHHSEVLVNADLMNDAFDGENEEHEQGTWAAIKSHPWAFFWAFTLCFTIVSLFPCIYVPRVDQQLMPSTRSWSRSTCF
jgi:MFS transporter, SP family, general alpha glucoside:H+ symporter